MSVINAVEDTQMQIQRLASFIMAEVPGEPRKSEGAVDCAIRLLRQLGDENKRLLSMIDYYKRRAK